MADLQLGEVRWKRLITERAMAGRMASRMFVMELLDPSGDARRWLSPLRALLTMAKGPDGDVQSRKEDAGLLGGRPGALLQRRSGDGLVVIVVSGPAVTMMVGFTDDVGAAMRSYPFAEATERRPMGSYDRPSP